MVLDAYLPKNMKKEQKDALLSSLDAAPTHTLVLNERKLADEEFRKRFPSALPHPFLKHVYSYDKAECEFGKMALYDLGCYSIQDSAAMLPPYALAPKKGERILDLCAAPGGKSIFLSLLSGQEAVIYANDISLSRSKELSSNIERMGLGDIIVTNDDFSKKTDQYFGYFDAIMLDVPCSGTAMWRKNPQAKREWSSAKMERCLEMQRPLLETAYSLLKPGGRMVYSTCSFCYEEDEGMLASFLLRHPDMHPQAIEEHEGYFHGETVPEGVYIFPSLYKGEGQFLCLLKKDGEAGSLTASNQKNTDYDDYFSFFGLEGRDNFEAKDALWSLPFPCKFDGLSVLRLGLKVSSSPYLEPDNALAHYLGSEYQAELSEKEALRYLKGETFPIELEEGFYVASFEGKGLGFFKMVKGQMKNRLPKGLRKSYRFI